VWFFFIDSYSLAEVKFLSLPPGSCIWIGRSELPNLWRLHSRIVDEPTPLTTNSRLPLPLTYFGGRTFAQIGHPVPYPFFQEVVFYSFPKKE